MTKTCINCDNLNKRYIGDEFDEFYEWNCSENLSEVIGCVDVFDNPPKIPTWCPKIKNEI